MVLNATSGGRPPLPKVVDDEDEPALMTTWDDGVDMIQEYAEGGDGVGCAKRVCWLKKTAKSRNCRGVNIIEGYN